MFYPVYLEVQKPIQNHPDFLNSVLTSISTQLKAAVALFSILPCHQPTQPSNQIFIWFLSLQINLLKQLKYSQENSDLAALKKFLSKGKPSKSPKSKSNSSQITIFRQLKKKFMYKKNFGPKNNLFVRCVFFGQHCNFNY